MRTRKSRLAVVLGLALVFGGSGCATNHLLRWNSGEPSWFGEPFEDYAPFVRPAGTVLGLPVTVAWDVVTFPFQWLWDVYPYGDTLTPDTRPDRDPEDGN